jgi:hypothetical protein
MSNEPVLIGGLVSAIIALVVSFGLKLSPDQIGAIMGTVSAVLAFLIRTQVSPSK